MPKSGSAKPFIPAKESLIVMRFFSLYSRWKIKRVFKHVYLDKRYQPTPDRSTLYFGNHSMWWDALTPLLLNTYLLKQRPRAVMEWEQVDKYSFFKKIGCFSIDRSDPRSGLKSLQYGIDWLNQPGNSLYLYPQGKIEHPYNHIVSFESGIGWMIPKLNQMVDIVPLTQISHLMHDDKPSLYLRLGEPITLPSSIMKKNEITSYLENIVKNELETLISISAPKITTMKIWI